MTYSHIDKAVVAGLYPLVGWKTRDETVYVAEGFSSDTGRCLEWASSIGKCKSLPIYPENSYNHAFYTPFGRITHVSRDSLENATLLWGPIMQKFPLSPAFP